MISDGWEPTIAARVVEIRSTEPTLEDVFFCILERLETTPEGSRT